MRRLFHALPTAVVSGVLLLSANAADAQEKPGAEGSSIAGTTAVVGLTVQAPGERAPQQVPPSRTIFWQEEAAGPAAPRDDVELVAVTRDAAWSAPWLRMEAGTPMHVGSVASFAGAEPADSRRRTAMPFESIRLRTDGSGVAVGDLLQLFRERREVPGTGSVYQPTGVVRVTEVAGEAVTGDVVALYALARLGDLARPVPAYDLQPGERAMPVEVSQRAGLLGFAAGGNVHSYGGVAFLDRGVRDGVRIGDEFVVLAPAAQARNGATQARLQVVGVAPDHTAARIVDLTSPVFAPDAPVLLDRRIR